VRIAVGYSPLAVGYNAHLPLAVDRGYAMPLDWSPFVPFVRRHERFLLTTHVRPDADGLGSIQALAEALETLGKQVERVIPSRLPPRYEFLDPTRKIRVFSDAGNSGPARDALIILDTGTWNQLADMGPFVRTFAGEKVVIDHHGTQDDLGAVRFVDTWSESTGRLAAQAIAALEVPLNPTVASNLFAALATDTGWFKHPNTTPDTFELAARLQVSGASPTSLHESIYERKTLPQILLSGLVLGRVSTRATAKVAYSYVRLADYAATGAVPSDTEDLINLFSGIEGVDVRLFGIEQRDGGMKVSLRARTTDVAKLAEQFGGGGHKLAAGATLPGPFETALERVLAAAETAVN
jgi:phosphoesterase RecJ-like protein